MDGRVCLHRNFNKPGCLGLGRAWWTADSLGTPSAYPKCIVPQSYLSASMKQTLVFIGTTMILIKRQECIVCGSMSSRLKPPRLKPQLCPLLSL